METEGLDKKAIEEANVVIKGIQRELGLAISLLQINDYDNAIAHMEKGKTLSNCPVCHKDISIAIADVIHTKSICHLGSDLCKDEKESLIDSLTFIKDEFVPIATMKKAAKDKSEGKLSEEPKEIEIEEPKNYGFRIPKASEMFPFLYNRKENYGK
ncbi:MAG: hypothetical protein O8C67_04875 [Candidatus Methanoperedens sp.]|nr:hypothetical protein [Candidatus Methanoperedens sp.]